MVESVTSEEEIEFWERQHYDDLANLYSIILATEHLERAYARDSITQKEVSTVFCIEGVAIGRDSTALADFA